MWWNELDESLKRVGPWTLGVPGAGGWWVGSSRPATDSAPAAGPVAANGPAHTSRAEGSTRGDARVAPRIPGRAA